MTALLVLAMLAGCLLFGGGLYVRDRLLFCEDRSIIRGCEAVSALGAIIAFGAILGAMT